MFGAKSVDLTGVFNSCWVFGCAKCGIYKPKWGRHKPDWANCSGEAAKDVRPDSKEGMEMKITIQYPKRQRTEALCLPV